MQGYLDTIGNDHPLMDLILRCIDHNPQERPHADTTVRQLAKSKIETQQSANKD